MSSREVVAATDLYARLGLGRDASTAQINTAYRQLALALHPDSAPTRGGDPGALQLVIEAHRILSDPRTRQLYDARTSPAPSVRPRAAPIDPCRVCRGTGTIIRSCMRCAGAGQVLADAPWLRAPTVCAVCHARGYDIARCGACDGTGRT